MKTTKVFKSGNSMAVRLPVNTVEGNEEFIVKKHGGMILLIPKDKLWDIFAKGLDNFSDDIFSEGRNQPLKDDKRKIF